MKKILKYNRKIYSQDDLIEALVKLGIQKGDIICSHSEIYSFGIPLLPIKDFLNALLECLFEVIGKEGTLIMPTFTYSFCKNEVYDKLNSKCTVGALNEFFRKQQGVKRTNDPIFSFAVKGAHEELFLNKEQKSCFDENCVYAILTRNNGKILNFGNKDCFTFVHYPIECAKVSYRYFKNFQGLIIDENKQTYYKNIQYYVRNLDAYETDVKIINFLTSKPYQKQINFAGSTLNLIKSQPFYKDLLETFKQNENIFRI
ncbi:AAC(3) family N-acetyltransferase [Campylobacter jejuni]|uniref:AAC(3) family N-acetyltransferase n=1 Tax=Campylobacter jejuni TaxID=197 RepID=UPI000F804FD1|nr:AAC(3) family N-acetyltransferase [Campylobacter jejuni]RTJ58391.1 acetyltransferase [Campylobacter jejuni]